MRTVTLPSTTRVCEQLVKQAHVSNFPTESASPAFVVSALRRVTQHAEVVALPLHDVADCPNLRTLKITTFGTRNHVFKNAASLPYPPHPTLRRLEILDQSGGAGLNDFIHRFFPNLEELKISLHCRDAHKTASLPDLGRFNLPQLQQLEIRGSSIFSVPLVRHILPATFPALQTCTWFLPYHFHPDLQAAFVAEVVDTLRHLRDQQADRAVPLKFKIDFAVAHDREKLQPMLEALGITKIGVERGGGVVVGFEPASPIDNGFPDPPDQILIPELCYTDEDKVEDLGNIISASLDRIRDLKDAAVAVGDRFQISRIAQALQEREWLCVERRC